MNDNVDVRSYMLESCTSSSIEAFRAFVPTEYPLHAHDYYELELVTNGNGYQYVNHERIPLEPGDLYLVTPDDVHSITATEPLSFISLHFLPKVPESFSLQLPKNFLYCQLKTLDHAFFSSLMERAADSSEKTNPYSEHELFATVVLTLTFLLRYGDIGRSKQTDSPMRQAIRYVQNHFSETDINLTRVATYCGFSPCYFSSRFKQLTGYGFNDYLIRFRLHHATKLLTKRELSITEIAYECGFSSLSNFFRCFRRVYGMTPACYQEQQT